MDITYKPNKMVKWVQIDDGSLFLTQYGELCVKLPEAKDEHGPTNCFSFEHKKYYFYKDHQEVGIVTRMEVII